MITVKSSDRFNNLKFMQYFISIGPKNHCLAIVLLDGEHMNEDPHKS